MIETTTAPRRETAMPPEWQSECRRYNCKINEVDFSPRAPGAMECECGETWSVDEEQLRTILAQCRDPQTPDPKGEADAQMHLDAMLYRKAFIAAGKKPPKVDLTTGRILE